MWTLWHDPTTGGLGSEWLVWRNVGFRAARSVPEGLERGRPRRRYPRLVRPLSIFGCRKRPSCFRPRLPSSNAPHLDHSADPGRIGPLPRRFDHIAVRSRKAREQHMVASSRRSDRRDEWHIPPISDVPPTSSRRRCLRGRNASADLYDHSAGRNPRPSSAIVGRMLI